MAGSAAKKIFNKQIFSAIQPTSIPHIGNYFGAIKIWVDQQNQIKPDENPMIIAIADLHALTLPVDPKVFNEYIYKCAATLIACGLDPKRTILYQQSMVPEHGQLSWILGCRATVSQLSQMHQVKTKTSGMTETPFGIFSYPILQTADILLFKSTHVPIGEDQVQHLEMARSIASKFNNLYKTNFFPAPKTIEGEFTKLKSLRDPSKKMSKSDPDQNGRIELTDMPDVIVKKIRKAVTDSQSAITYDPETRPGVGTLLEIESACTGKEIEEIVESCYLASLDTGEYKKKVAEALIDHLKPIQNEYARLIKDKAYLRKCLDDGGEKASSIASQTYSELCSIIGAK